MKNILLVDDEHETAIVFQTGLAAAGYQVVLAQDAKTGLEQVKQSKFDLIILDQMMPDMSGNSVLGILKSADTTKAIPVLMLTNFNQDELLKEALSLGASDYVLKYQVEPKDLVVKVKALIGE